jgi:hypothetical protein
LALTLRIESLPDVAEYQAANDSRGIHIKVVPRGGAKRERLRAALVNSIRAEIEVLGAVAPPIEIAFVDGLERQRKRMGKIELVGATRTTTVSPRS